MPRALSWLQDWLAPEPSPSSDHLLSRWLFLRALGLIFFSAFYSYWFQIQGLIGPNGILPAGQYLQYLQEHVGILRYWYVPTVFWWGSGAHALQILCGLGLAASLALTLNWWPRGSLLACLILFLSFISVSQDFASYQSDGMLLEAAFISLFLVPGGWRPRFGEHSKPIRLSVLLLQWEWFRIYFESGLVKLLSGDPHWRHLTAMDDYYQNGPLPTWLGWYAQQRLPHLIHAGTALLTLVVELGVVWMLFLPRRFRLACFVFLVFFQAGIILTANYAFLNYIVVALSIFLVDDGYLRNAWSWVSKRTEVWDGEARTGITTKVVSGFFLSWVLYATSARLLLLFTHSLPIPFVPIEALEPFRFANQYGLFAVMTPARYEIEFQSSTDGATWTPYRFRYKPQAIDEAPGIYAPYQPRFEWNLWFASLGSWRDYPWVLQTEARLLEGSPAVLSLFRADSSLPMPPIYVRAVFWQYWFSDVATHRQTGAWWRREDRGLYAPELGRRRDGKIEIVQYPIASS